MFCMIVQNDYNVNRNVTFYTAFTFITFSIKKKTDTNVSVLSFYEYIKLDRDKSTFKSHRDFSSEKEITFKHL